MKNREYRALLTFALMMSLVVSSVKGTPSYVYAKENSAVVSEAKTASDQKEESASENVSGANARKDETVFAKVDGSGQVTSVTVSDQLKNVSSQKQIQDVSDLKEIENVKGDEKFKQLGDSLVWSGDHKDICYQGTTDKELPVGIRISYKLDGKDISEKELKGKSGHLSIHYEYENTTADKNQAYTPFLMVTGLMLDTEKFSNVTIDNGKIVSDGSKDLAIGMGIPKMKEELGVEDLDIPDSFVVEADVTDYDTIEGITVATNDLFNQLDTDQFDSLDDLNDSMGQLKSAADQLVSGSGELKAGLDTLLASSGTLIDGIDQLSTGSKTLKDGTNTLQTGAGALKDGAGQVAAGAANAADSTAKQLVPGVQALDQGVSDMQNQLEQGIPRLVEGVAQAADGAKSLDEGAEQLKNGIQDASNKAGELAEEARRVASYVKNNGQVTVNTEVSVAAFNDNSNVITQLRALETEENAQAIENIISQLEAPQQVPVTQSVSLEPTIGDDAQKVADGLSGLSAILNTSSTADKSIGKGITDLKVGASQLNAALNTSEKGLKDGTADLVEQLNNGVASLKGGTGMLLRGKDGKSGVLALSKGLNDLSAGAGEVVTGTTKLSSGAKDLNSGAGALASGIGALKSGSGALVDGVTQLDDGAGALSEGMIQFNEDGIKKLVSAFDGDISGMLDKLNGMLDASKEYKNFAGISDGMDGEVKFVFVTEK
ncbi:hypothetical protein [[Clostridium] scindens]|uniref:hypothetical protein n=1 Tax=Clostridium scindens (strain JCM 10418 / VPI 12708) TaxID=29347 RepID=UPI0039A35A39